MASFGESPLKLASAKKLDPKKCVICQKRRSPETLITPTVKGLQSLVSAAKRLNDDILVWLKDTFEDIDDTENLTSRSSIIKVAWLHTQAKEIFLSSRQVVNPCLPTQQMIVEQVHQYSLIAVNDQVSHGQFVYFVNS